MAIGNASWSLLLVFSLSSFFSLLTLAMCLLFLFLHFHVIKKATVGDLKNWPILCSSSHQEVESTSYFLTS